MLNWFKINVQYVLPKHLISRLVGKLAAAKAGKLTTWLITLFIKQFRVNMQEAQWEKPEDYATFNAFFTRPLKDGIRPIDDDPQHLCHAVDGAVSQAGAIEQDKLIQAKGHHYSLTALLGGKPELAAPFKQGQFATIYLSPKDYHRIHMPIEGTLTDMIYVPGELFSVNPLTAENVPGLFARNERVVTLFDTPAGKMALVLVGATIVASIETVWAGTVTPPATGQLVHWQYETDSDSAIALEKGQEMGRFKLGSTIVVCFEPDAVTLNELVNGQPTKLGEHFATVSKH